MAFDDTKQFDLKRIQEEFNINPRKIENLQGKEAELEKIYNHYRLQESELEKIKSEVLTKLNAKLSGCVHSIRCRIKDSDHLVEKIIRNMTDNPKKYAGINADNYYKIITDLIGVRIIILDKRDWLEVHNSLLQIFRNLPDRYVISPEDTARNYDKYSEEANKEGKEFNNSYHAEKPVVYITSEDDRSLYKDDNLKVDNSKLYYRSIHYIIRYKWVYFEIQVRTLFEEGWLEFDHRIKYPYDQNNKRKQEYAGVLSSLAVAADKLISFYEETEFKNNSDDIIDEKETLLQSAENTNEEEVQTLDGKMKILF